MNVDKIINIKWPSSYLPEMPKKAIRYVILGTTGMFVQTWLFMLTLWCMGNPIKDSFWYYVAFAIGFILEMIPNYILSNWYTFETRPTKKNARGFVIARSINLVLQFTLLPLMVWLLPSWNNDVLSYGCIFTAGIINFLLLNLFFKKPKPKPTMKIYRANLIDTPTKDAFRVLYHGYIAVEDTGIIHGTYETLPDELKGLPVEDLGDKMMIPAFCDMHVHAPQYRNMGLALDLELLPWLNTYTFPEESKYKDLEYAKRMYRRFVHELWMQGTMHSVVFSTIHYEATRCLADLFVESGLSAMVGQVGMDRNCPDNLSNTTGELVQDIRDLDAYLKQQCPDGRVRTIVTPRFVPTCSDEMMSELGKVAKELNLSVQSHLSENRSEIAWVKELAPEAENYGDAYNRFGLFGQQPTLMAHCVHTDKDELKMLKENGVIVVHCPMSNMNLGSGMAPIRRFLNEGIHVALGTDVSGGHNMSMLRAIQYAIQVSKFHYGASGGKMPFLSQSEAFYLATTAGGAFFGNVGCFNAGNSFDALVIDDSYLNYDNYTLEQRLERYFYLGDDRDIKRRFCGGKELCEPTF